MTAFYNEIDPYAAQWLRNLIAAGHIAPGVVDERSIEDISPDELSEFTQCHFFAGVGAWSLALRRAGWPDDRPVWTGSCPCQPFSAAGQGAGFTDARHLWPSFAWLIANAKPTVVFGEQVASKAVGPWVDLVHADLETLGYAFGAIPFPSAGVGAPHIRDRLYWVGDSYESRSQRFSGDDCAAGGAGPKRSASPSGMPDGLADSEGLRRREGIENAAGGTKRAGTEKTFGRSSFDSNVSTLGLGNADCKPAWGNPGAAHAKKIEHGPKGGNCDGFGDAGSSFLRVADADCKCEGSSRHPSGAGDFSGGISTPNRLPGPVNGFWRGADWLGCRDDRFRPVEPGSFPLVARPAAGMGSVQPGLSRLYGRNKTGRLKAYGNAINAEAAHEFIAAYLDGLTHSS